MVEVGGGVIKEKDFGWGVFTGRRGFLCSLEWWLSSEIQQVFRILDKKVWRGNPEFGFEDEKEKRTEQKEGLYCIFKVWERAEKFKNVQLTIME